MNCNILRDNRSGLYYCAEHKVSFRMDNHPSNCPRKETPMARVRIARQKATLQELAYRIEQTLF